MHDVHYFSKAFFSSSVHDTALALDHRLAISEHVKAVYCFSIQWQITLLGMINVKLHLFGILVCDWIKFCEISVLRSALFFYNGLAVHNHVETD